MIWTLFVNAQTKGAKYLTQLLSTEDIIQEDLENRKQLLFNRARGDDDSSHGTKFRTYVHINPNVTVSPMCVGKVLGIPDRDRVYATRLRLSSHKFTIETGRWSRIPREDRLCLCGVSLYLL